MARYKETKTNGGTLYVYEIHNCDPPKAKDLPLGSIFVCDCSRRWYVADYSQSHDWAEDIFTKGTPS